VKESSKDDGDLQLVRLAQAGDRGAFGGLVEWLAARRAVHIGPLFFFSGEHLTGQNAIQIAFNPDPTLIRQRNQP